MELRLVEIAILLVYFISLIVIGFIFKNKSSQSESDFYIAGKSLGPFVNGLAIYAATCSAASYMGFIGLGYKLGLPVALVIQTSAGAGYAMAQFAFAAPLQRFNKFSINDFFNARFGATAGFIATILTVVLMAANMVPQLMGGGFIMNYLTGMSNSVSIIIITSIFALYVLLGGMYAITWTDVIQASVAILSFFIISVALLATFGGYASIASAAAAVNPNFASVHPAMPYLSYVGLFATTFFFMGCSPHLAQRQLAAGSPAAGRWSMIYALIFVGILNFLAYMVMIPAGIATFPDLQNPDMTIIMLTEKFMPAVVGGIVFAGILAAIQSTVSAGLLVLGTAISNDIYKKFRPNAGVNELLLVARIGMIVSVIVVVFFALRELELIGILVALVLGGFSSTFFFPLLLGIWWKRANKWGGIMGMVGGFVVYIYCYAHPAVPQFVETLIGAGVSLVLTVLASLVTRPPDKNTNQLMEEMQGIEFMG